MQEVIKVRQLTKSYHKLPAADNVSFSVNKGMVFGLLGANGAGKSTTIECILGTKRADRGEISVLGMNPLKDRKKLFEKVGVQFQETSCQEQITVAELCEVTASLYHNAADPGELLERFGISDKKKRSGKGFIRRTKTTSVHCPCAHSESGACIFGRTDNRAGCQGTPGSLENSFHIKRKRLNHSIDVSFYG